MQKTSVGMLNIDIGWASWSKSIERSHWREVVQDKPEKLIAQQLVEGDIKHCPAFAAFYKNTFAIKIPFDLSLCYQADKVRISPHTNLQLNSVDVEDIIQIIDTDNSVTIQIMLNNTFVSDTPYVEVETLPPSLHSLHEEIRYMNGRFDCHAWQRPLQFGFQIPKETLDNMKKTSENIISFKKDDVVMYVRFNTPKKQSVKLYTMDADDVENLTKHVNRNMSLPNMIRNFNFAEVIDRVRYRRPKKFLRNKKYDNDQ